MANGVKDVLLTADEESDKYYAKVIEIHLNELEPHVNGPSTPDSHPISQLKSAVSDSDWPKELSHTMVDSCSNSSYEDLDKARQIVRQASVAGPINFKPPFLLTPGSERIRTTVEADGGRLL